MPRYTRRLRDIGTQVSRISLMRDIYFTMTRRTSEFCSLDCRYVAIRAASHECSLNQIRKIVPTAARLFGALRHAQPNERIVKYFLYFRPNLGIREEAVPPKHGHTGSRCDGP